MRSFVLLQSLILLCAVCLAVDLPRGLLVVVNSGEDSVTLVDLLHPKALPKIATRKHPQDVVVSPDGSLAYVAEMGTPAEPGNTIAVINLPARNIIKRSIRAAEPSTNCGIPSKEVPICLLFLRMKRNST